MPWLQADLQGGDVRSPVDDVVERPGRHRDFRHLRHRRAGQSGRLHHLFEGVRRGFGCQGQSEEDRRHQFVDGRRCGSREPGLRRSPAGPGAYSAMQGGRQARADPPALREQRQLHPGHSRRPGRYLRQRRQHRGSGGEGQSRQAGEGARSNHSLLGRHRRSQRQARVPRRRACRADRSSEGRDSHGSAKEVGARCEQLQRARHPLRQVMSLFVHYLSLPYLIEGIWFTLAVTALGLAGGLILGLVLAAMQLSRFWMLAAFARGYTVIFRGTPLILQMVFAYDALPPIGLKLSAVGAAGLALAANEAPFIAEMLRAGVLGVDRGQVLAGQALGMTPALLMRRIIAPQAIRTMIPAFGNETVSALKNSSLASVISVQELTLRSTQLASSTFDFFSIFFASGLIYLVLTTAVSVIQLFVERALDLDRTTPQDRLAIFLPWRRVDLSTKLKLAEQAAAPTVPAQGAADIPPPPPRPSSRADRAKHAAMVERNNVAVEVTELRKKYGEQTVLDGLDLTVRVGEVVALMGPSGSGKSTLLRCINHLENWDSGMVRVGGRRLGHRDDGKPLSPRAIANERASVGVGMVFQQFNLFSHLTAHENVAGPLRWVHGMTRINA